jgi:hypothetical protein
MFEIDTDGKKTFESIVNFTKFFYKNLKDDYILMFHCKSGKDRTSVFDAIIQATLQYITKGDETGDEMEIIKKYSQKFLIFGFIISYYGTGNVGLKLNNIPAAKYILDNKSIFDFYKGHSDYFASSF